MSELQSTNELIVTRPIEIVSSNFCRGCGSRLTSNDNFCGHCGSDCRDLIVGPSSVGHVAEPAHQESKEIATVNNTTATFQAIVDNRLVVAGLVACFGPLGLLAMWFSQRISNRAKIITTASYVLLFIVAPLVVIWYWLDVALRPVVEVLSK